ncbi:MAG: TlpA family protein disulfide reductase [Ignavibacteria bacterium]|nr:TlpA family protein disulfide reductase [Ignavibacteria bacterium]
MKKIFLIVVFLFLISGIGLSQNVKILTSTDEIDEIKKQNEGKVVLYNFWATWCGPCKEEFPDLMKLYNNYKDEDFVIVFFSLDIPEQIDTKLKPFLKNHSVNFLTYLIDFQNNENIIDYFDKDFGGAIPTTYIYDKSGNLKQKLVGSREYNQFESLIKDLL